MEDFARAMADFVRDHRRGQPGSFYCWLRRIACLHIAADSGLGGAGRDRRVDRVSASASGRSGLPAGSARSWRLGSPTGSASGTRAGRADMAAVAYPEILPRGEVFVKNWGVPSIFIGRFFRTAAGLGGACRRHFRNGPYWRFQFAISYRRWSGPAALLLFGDVIAYVSNCCGGWSEARLGYELRVGDWE